MLSTNTMRIYMRIRYSSRRDVLGIRKVLSEIELVEIIHSRDILIPEDLCVVSRL